MGYVDQLHLFSYENKTIKCMLLAYSIHEILLYYLSTFPVFNIT